MLQEIEELKQKRFICRNARLLWEWENIDRRLRDNDEILYCVKEKNGEGIPIIYEVKFNIRSFCGVMEKDENGLEKPVIADKFIMRIEIPNNFPSVDSKLNFVFLTKNGNGEKISYPWHPNIRFFGDFAGKVCLNREALGSYADLALYIEKVALYLKYEKYHAFNTPPYPEDDIVANWVIKQAEPNGWIDDLKNGFTRNLTKYASAG
jgi:hypothetical protein